MSTKIDEVVRRQSDFPTNVNSTPMRQLFMNLKFNTPIQEAENSIYGSESASNSGINIVAGLGQIASIGANQSTSS